MGIFSSSKMFTEKEMKWNNFKNSGVMRKLLGNKKIAEVLDQRVEQKEFYEVLKKKAPGGVTRDEVREALSELKEKGKTLTGKEVQDVAYEIFPEPFANRYKRAADNDTRFSPKSSATSRLPGPASNPVAPGAPRFSPPVRSSPKSFPTRPTF